MSRVLRIFGHLGVIVRELVRRARLLYRLRSIETVMQNLAICPFCGVVTWKAHPEAKLIERGGQQFVECPPCFQREREKAKKRAR